MVGIFCFYMSSLILYLEAFCSIIAKTVGLCPGIENPTCCGQVSVDFGGQTDKCLISLFLFSIFWSEMVVFGACSKLSWVYNLSVMHEWKSNLLLKQLSFKNCLVFFFFLIGKKIYFRNHLWVGERRKWACLGTPPSNSVAVKFSFWGEKDSCLLSIHILKNDWKSKLPLLKKSDTYYTYISVHQNQTQSWVGTLDNKRRSCDFLHSVWHFWTSFLS